MTGVQGDPEAIRKFQRSIKSVRRDIGQLTSKLSSQLTTLENSWPDGEGRNFCEEMRHEMNSLRRFEESMTELIGFLDKKATPLENYLGR